jgi:hypothetical protein
VPPSPTVPGQRGVVSLVASRIEMGEPRGEEGDAREKSEKGT